MGIPLDPEPLQTPENVNSRVSRTQIYEPGELGLFFLILPGHDFSSVFDSPSYTFWLHIDETYARIRDDFVRHMYSVSERCRENDAKCLSENDMGLKNGDDDDDICFFFNLERMNCGSVKKWFLHHIKDRPVFELRNNVIDDLSYYSENVNCNKVEKWFVHHIKDRPVF